MRSLHGLIPVNLLPTAGMTLLLLGFLLSVPVMADTGNNSPDAVMLLSGMTTEERVGQLFMPAISVQRTSGTR